jgi:excinuclease ABC subunit B
LVQTIGRAARNVNGKVVMYADTITNSMRLAIDETNRRRRIQMEYNIENGIIPTTIHKSKQEIFEQTKVADSKKGVQKFYVESENASVAADPVVKYMNKNQLTKLINETKRNMEKAAKDLDFIQAARFRDELAELNEMLKTSK